VDDFLVEKVILEEVSLKMWTEPVPEMSRIIFQYIQCKKSIKSMSLNVTA